MPLAERRDNPLRRAGVHKKGDTLFLKREYPRGEAREDFVFELRREQHAFGIVVIADGDIFCVVPRVQELAKLRRRIETDPKRLEKLVRKLNKSRFTLSGKQFKRPKGDVGKLLNPWYNAKNIAVGYDDNPAGVLFFIRFGIARQRIEIQIQRHQLAGGRGGLVLASS